MNLPCLFVLAVMCGGVTEASPKVGLRRNDAAGQLAVLIDDRETVVYQYGRELALPHYWPLCSPSGKSLTVQHPERYPHHRSLWIADHVQAEDGPAVDFYHCWKNYKTANRPDSGYRHYIRHRRFGDVKAAGQRAVVEAELQWIVDDDRPILDERRTLRLVALGDGEYLLDLEWELKPTHGNVKFLSDVVHYAWPYVRMDPQFSAAKGGVVVNEKGKSGQVGTDGKVANWVDFSNTIDAVTEGLAVMPFPDGTERKWLTRDYGAFGPRREGEFSGTQFTLKSGQSLKGRVGILIHRGNATSGRVAERYQQYIEGRF